VSLEEIGAWIPIEITTEKEDIVERTTGLLNGGFRTLRPTIALPLPLCRKFGIEGLYFVGNNRLMRTNRRVYVRIVTRDRVTDWVKAEALVFLEDRILISTALADALGVGVFSLHRGTWFFQDEPNNLRDPVKPKLYKLAPRV